MGAPTRRHRRIRTVRLPALGLSLLFSTLAISTVSTTALTGAAEAKAPGATYCFYRTCHRVKTLAETRALVGSDLTLSASYYDDCRRDRLNPCGLTSSGERFDPSSPNNAASPILPDGTKVLVWSPESGEAAVLRINNAGPYWGNRKLDVSRATAKHLGFAGRGVARLKVRVLEAPSRAEATYRKNRRYEPVAGALGAYAGLDAAAAGMTALAGLEAVASAMLAPLGSNAGITADGGMTRPAGIDVAMLDTGIATDGSDAAAEGMASAQRTETAAAEFRRLLVSLSDVEGAASEPLKVAAAVGAPARARTIHRAAQHRRVASAVTVSRTARDRVAGTGTTHRAWRKPPRAMAVASAEPRRKRDLASVAVGRPEVVSKWSVIGPRDASAFKRASRQAVAIPGTISRGSKLTQKRVQLKTARKAV